MVRTLLVVTPLVFVATVGIAQGRTLRHQLQESHSSISFVSMCVKRRRRQSPRYIRRNVRRERVDRIIARGGGFIGDPVPGYDPGYVFSNRCRPYIDQSLVDPSPPPPPDVYDCNQCPCGYYDGCNQCSCGSPAGPAACTLRFCEVLEEPQCNSCPSCDDDAYTCPDGTVLSRDQYNNCQFPECPAPPPVDYDCDQCPCGYYDGCNFCTCGSPPRSGPGACSRRFCETWFEPRCDPCPICDDDTYTCPDGTVILRDQYNDCEFPQWQCPPLPPPPPSQCCDPYSKPRSEVCFEGIECCPNTGEWSCSWGDGMTYTCGDLTITGNYGEPCGCPEDLRLCPDGSEVKRDPYNYCEFASCPEPPPQCCDPLEEPGEFGNPICFEGAACCPDGTWSCSIGDARSFPCGGEIITSGFGQACALDCEVCPGGFFDGCNSCGCEGDGPFPICTLRACSPREFRPKTCDQEGTQFCTQDVYECPDGSSVGRDPNNNCDFFPCRGPPPQCCDPLKEPGEFGNPICFEGAACCPDGTWSCSIGDATSFPCGGEIITSGFGQACALDCEVCPGGFFDGCNSCSCLDDSPYPICTEIACRPGQLRPKTCDQEGTQFCTQDVFECPDGSFVGRDPNNNCEFYPCTPGSCTQDVQSCPDGSFVGRDPSNGCAFFPCPINCDTCECGYNDGCNDCQCYPDGTVACTERYCVWEGIPSCLRCPPQTDTCTQDVKTCPDGSFVGRDPSSGCAFFPCPDETCCDPNERPGFGGNSFCTDGVTCCEDCCSWSCGIGNGSFGCDAVCNPNN